MGTTFAFSQSDGTLLVFGDCVKLIVKIEVISVAEQCWRQSTYTGIQSGPEAL